MTKELKPPILIQPIPAQVINEGAVYTLNLNDFIESPDAASGVVRFFADLTDGRALPQGVICTSDGMVSGIPAKGTQGSYDVTVVAENDSGLPFTAQFQFTIKQRIEMEKIDRYFTDLKGKVWEALEEGLPPPDLTELLKRPITHDDIYFLIQRFATFKVWDVFNLDPPGEAKLLQIEGVSEHFNVYDRGSYIVGVPKDLFSQERTIEHALQTAKAMAREAYRRSWTVELTGLVKMARACWVELQLLMEKHGKRIEIINYSPTPKDVFLFNTESRAETVFGRKLE